MNIFPFDASFFHLFFIYEQYPHVSLFLFDARTFVDRRPRHTTTTVAACVVYVLCCYCSTLTNRMVPPVGTYPPHSSRDHGAFKLWYSLQALEVVLGSRVQ